MRGQRFTEDRSVLTFLPDGGWSVALPELPFRVRDVQMMPLRGRLLFYTVADPATPGICLRLLEPQHGHTVVEAAFHR